MLNCSLRCGRGRQPWSSSRAGEQPWSQRATLVTELQAAASAGDDDVSHIVLLQTVYLLIGWWCAFMYVAGLHLSRPAAVRALTTRVCSGPAQALA